MLLKCKTHQLQRPLVESGVRVVMQLTIDRIVVGLLVFVHGIQISPGSALRAELWRLRVLLVKQRRRIVQLALLTRLKAAVLPVDFAELAAFEFPANHSRRGNGGLFVGRRRIELAASSATRFHSRADARVSARSKSHRRGPSSNARRNVPTRAGSGPDAFFPRAEDALRASPLDAFPERPRRFNFPRFPDFFGLVGGSLGPAALLFSALMAIDE